MNPVTITPTAKANCRPQNSGHCQSGGSLEQPPQKQTQLLLFLFRDTPHLRRPTVGVPGGHLLSQMEHLHLPLFSPTNQIARLITYHPTSSHLPQGPREGWGREAASPNLKHSVQASMKERPRMKNGGHPPQTRSGSLHLLAVSLAPGCQTEEGGNKRSNASRGRG